MAPQPHIQGRTCTGELALETGHLWGALVGGHPTKPQKEQFFNWTVVGKLSCFRELYFFPKPLVWTCIAQTISHGSPPFLGGTLCGKKNALFSTQSSRKSVTFGTVPFFLFWSSKTLWKRSSSISRPPLSFPHTATLLSWRKWKVVNGMVERLYR